ncbi:MAG: RDD family protein [Acidobacteriota bacterium]
MLVSAKEQSVAVNQRSVRCECGARLMTGARFCPRCGAAAHIIRPTAVATESRALTRRILAEVVDRLAPLPFIAYLFPPWVLVVVAYHLICDGAPSGRSPGKWIFRLRVVSISSNEPCGVGRSILRRLPTALGQAAYCSWVFVPLVIAYELVSLAFVWLNPTGRRFEDYFARTQVISEGQYQKLRPLCGECGLRIAVAAQYCPHCGMRRA